ncbi:MAG: hypothetical protein P0Y53_14295 [Candidatus Pseudobacter hemicellulosilyticus]|uniref:DUF6850 domain-containing protein n=1 Tax=Candidatus Pseudobacter hemicellulosilyticus TaxID=3121375 RepID=A0AAJ5WPK3_9BACT|nr:MAG: hypothetical protein P0Y53_14295 [Pseudobacter sp.]
MFKRIIYLLSLFGATTALGQDTLSSANGKLLLLPFRNPWINSHNAAGLATLPVPGLGRTYAGAGYEDGSLKRAQQPGSSTLLQFASERYQQLQTASLYGRFSFQQVWDKDVRMNAVLDPYRRNPYVLGDSLGGDWKKQHYELELKAAVPLNKDNSFIAGAGVLYKAGTGARQNDPRPLTNVNDMALSPSLLWKLHNNWTIGVNGQFDFYKEEISVTTSNPQDMHYVYRLAGLGNYYQEIMTGYTRYYKGSTMGGGMQLQWEREGLQVLLDGGFAYRKEDAQDGVTIPRIMGRFSERQARLSGTVNYLAGSMTHQWQGSWKSFNGEGQDLHYGQTASTEPIKLVNDDVVNSTYYNEAGLQYRWIKDAFQDDFKWMLEASVVYNGMDLRYNYPRSRQTIDANEYTLKFSRNHIVTDARNFLWTLSVGLRDNFTAFNDYKPFGGQTNLVMDQYLLPDQAWLSSDIFKAGLSAEYRFPLNQRALTSLYVRASGNIWSRMGNDASLTGKQRNFAAISFGMTY